MAYYDPRTVELGEEIRRLERELEIAKLEKKVRELKEQIDEQKGYKIVPCPGPPCAPTPWNPYWNPYYPEITWTDTSSVTAPSGCYTIYY